MKQFIRTALFCLFPNLVAGQDLSHVPLDQLKAADIVLLGETHDNELHHKGQAELIRRINPSAVVFEMLSPNQAKIVNTEPKIEPSQMDEKIGWNAAGWPDYALYLPIFEAITEIPVFGAALPHKRVRQAFSDGAFKTYGKEGARFKLDQKLTPAEQAQREELQYRAHCEAMPKEMMAGMVEAQRFRDAAFAQTALDALAQYGAPVVVIAGHGHVRSDWGMPYMISLARPETETVSLAFLETTAQTQDTSSEMNGRFDIIVFTEPVEREDPCAQFSKE